MDCLFCDPEFTCLNTHYNIEADYVVFNVIKSELRYVGIVMYP